MHDHSTDIIGGAVQAGLAVIVPWLMEKMKASPLIPLFNRHAGTINFGLSAVFAILTTAGVGIEWTDAVGGGGTLSLTFPAWEILARSLAQIVVHEAVYRLKIKPAAVAALPQDPTE